MRRGHRIAVELATMRPILRLTVALVMVTLLPSAVALAAPKGPQSDRKLDKALQQALLRDAGEQVPVIIQTTAGGRRRVAGTISGKGHQITGDFRGIDAI